MAVTNSGKWFFGANKDTESPFIALENTADWEFMNFSPEGLDFGDLAGEERVKRLEIPFPEGDSLKQYVYPGSLVDWEFSANFNFRIVGPPTGTAESKVRAELMVLSTLTPSMVTAFPQGEANNPITDYEVYGGVNYNFVLKAEMTLRSHIHVGTDDYKKVGRIGWEFAPNCVWNVSRWRDEEEVISTDTDYSMTIPMKLKHKVPSAIIDSTRTRALPYIGDRHSNLVALYLKTPEEIPQDKRWQLSYLTKRPLLRFGEEPYCNPLNVNEYRDTAGLEGKKILINSFERPPLYKRVHTYESGIPEPYYADIDYCDGTDQRYIDFFSYGFVPYQERFNYKPMEKIWFYNVLDGPLKGYYLYYPYYISNRLYLRLSQVGNGASCTASVSNITIKTAAPNTL